MDNEFLVYTSRKYLQITKEVRNEMLLKWNHMWEYKDTENIKGKREERIRD